jgi:hypothetical protein
MPVNPAALQMAIAEAHDAWLGEDGLGPERYLYRCALDCTLDRVRMNMFCEYWGVDRGYLRKRKLQAILGKHWIYQVGQARRRNHLVDTLICYDELLCICANYGGPSNAESPSSKFLFNFFPNTGYVIDRRSDESIKNFGINDSTFRRDRFRQFFALPEIVRLRQDITGHLRVNVDGHALDHNEVAVWAGRFIDKYLFHAGKNGCDDVWQSTRGRQFSDVHGAELAVFFANALRHRAQ